MNVPCPLAEEDVSYSVVGAPLARAHVVGSAPLKRLLCFPGADLLRYRRVQLHKVT